MSKIADDSIKGAASATAGRLPVGHFDITTIALFTSVVELRNIARASRENNIAASAVSKRISDLELRVGVPLLYRLKDGVDPTPAGLALHRHARKILRQIEDLDAELSEYTSGERGQIRLWANTSAVTQFLPEDLRYYLEIFPLVDIQLREENSSAIVNAVRDGAADIGVFSEHVEAVGLDTRVYRRDTLWVIMPKGHELDGKQRIKLSELAKYDQVGLQEGSSLQEKIFSEARSAAQQTTFKVRVLSFDAIRRMVEARLGIAILPEGAVMPYSGTGMFSSAILDERWATRSLLIGFREYRSLPVVARKLIDSLAPCGSNGS